MTRIIKFRFWIREFLSSGEFRMDYNSDNYGISQTGKPIYLDWGGGVNEMFYDLKVMQFTGLLDKNGKEIYEGDILKEGGFVPCEVRWDEKKTGFRVFISGTNYGITPKYEIIGNLYENPELLESGKE